MAEHTRFREMSSVLLVSIAGMPKIFAIETRTKKKKKNAQAPDMVIKLTGKHQTNINSEYLFTPLK